MHIPDGFLDIKTWTALGAVSVVGVSFAVRKLKQDEEYSAKVPMIGMTAAFIFAAQMINFPVAQATSGQLEGAVLASWLYGPWAAILVMSAVVIIQSLFFLDGGLTAIGANIFNLGLLPIFLAYFLYKPFRAASRRWVKAIGIFITAWTAVVVSSVAVAAQLAISGTFAFIPALKALMIWHSLIGIGEGIITAAVVLYVADRIGQSGRLGMKGGQTYAKN